METESYRASMTRKSATAWLALSQPVSVQQARQFPVSRRSFQARPCTAPRSRCLGTFSDPDVNKVLRGLFDEVLWKNEEMMLDDWGAFGEFGRPYIYDVFLSLRGEDTRSSFAGHLHAALKQRRIAVFMDDEELGKGEEIALAILRATGVSRISIVVLSENYASSCWCLDELLRIVECRDTMGAGPVAGVLQGGSLGGRNQRGRYGQGLVDHEERLKSKGGDFKKVKRWREALTEAAYISG